MPAEHPPKGGDALLSPLKHVSTCGGVSRKYSWLRSFLRPRAATKRSSSLWICASVRQLVTAPLTGHWLAGNGCVSKRPPPKVVAYRENEPVGPGNWAEPNWGFG